MRFSLFLVALISASALAAPSTLLERQGGCVGDVATGCAACRKDCGNLCGPGGGGTAGAACSGCYTGCIDICKPCDGEAISKSCSDCNGVPDGSGNGKGNCDNGERCSFCFDVVFKCDDPSCLANPGDNGDRYCTVDNNFKGCPC